MTSEIKQRCNELAISEWGSEWERLPQLTREEITRRAIEDVRLTKIKGWLCTARGENPTSLFQKGAGTQMNKRS